MSSENVKQFTDSNFDGEVLMSAEPVLVDFWADWCMPCRTLGPIVEQVADELAGKAKVGKVDVEANKSISLKYNITALPTIIIFKGGQPTKKFVGFKKKDELMAALNEASTK